MPRLGAQREHVGAPVVHRRPDRDGLVDHGVHEVQPAVLDGAARDARNASGGPQALLEVVLVAKVLQQDGAAPALTVQVRRHHLERRGRLYDLVPVQRQHGLHHVVEQKGDVQDGLPLGRLAANEPRERDEVLVRDVVGVDVRAGLVPRQEEGEVDRPRAASVDRVEDPLQALLLELHQHPSRCDPAHPPALHDEAKLEPIVLPPPVVPLPDEVQHGVELRPLWRDGLQRVPQVPLCPVGQGAARRRRRRRGGGVRGRRGGASQERALFLIGLLMVVPVVVPRRGACLLRGLVGLRPREDLRRTPRRPRPRGVHASRRPCHLLPREDQRRRSSSGEGHRSPQTLQHRWKRDKTRYARSIAVRSRRVFYAHDPRFLTPCTIRGVSIVSKYQSLC
mmetsp:Transcript_162/g.671  ORF Transcript_162/g.671 Transcript_162/m.671 type:complete len:393 (-) Transcript_162:57-1235(-)